MQHGNDDSLLGKILTDTGASAAGNGIFFQGDDKCVIGS